jgi:thiamine-phosphate pyrophosphorylase
MNNNFRVIDANLNRCTEALRVLEEIARFHLDDKALTEDFKHLRHRVTQVFHSHYDDLVRARNTEEDVGTDLDNTSQRKNLSDLMYANFKRAQQALRVLEEYIKLELPDSEMIFQQTRYDLYTLEKTMTTRAKKLLKAKRFEGRHLYLVTDRTNFNTEDSFLDTIVSAIKGGVSIVQLREKTATTKEFTRIARSVRTICAEFDALFIINDRIDIAMAVEADGVHLGQDDMDIVTARRLLGDFAIIGNSTHKPEDAFNAMANGADYIGVGPVFTTPTKLGREAVGYEYVQWASENVNIPFFAIGGINETNIDKVLEAGAKRVAIVRAIMNAENPEKSAQVIHQKLQCERTTV